jgi:hypothetical protein
MKQLAAHAKEPIPSLTSSRSDLSDSINTAFQQMLAKRPADRYRSMDDATAALQQALYGGGAKLSERKDAFSGELYVIAGLAALVGVIAGAMLFSVLY